MSSPELRVGIVGAGAMGADHAARITNRINGARVTAIVEPDPARAESAASLSSDASVFPSLEAAADAIDAVLIATPGPAHEEALLSALEAELEILCEKPLTPDSASSLRIVEAEQKHDRPHIQVGFMRRFDPEYVQLRNVIASGELGALLGLHCAHRNRVSNPGCVDSMLITDSVVHEIDTVAWLADEPITAVEVRHMRRNSLAPEGLNEPQLVLLETASGVLADVEMSVNAQLGYQVRTEAVFEKGVAEIGRSSGIAIYVDGMYNVDEHQDFRTRFATAYDIQVQRWVDAAREGRIDEQGCSAWDGYLAALVCEAGVAAQATGARVEVEKADKPAFYN